MGARTKSSTGDTPNLKPYESWKRLAVYHARVRHQRHDWLNQLSSRFIRRYDTLCIEDLNLRGLVKTKLAKSFTDTALGAFVGMLSYKARWKHRQIVQVDRFFASSKTCHVFQHLQPLELSVREWRCRMCNTLHDRDINAAINILLEGLRMLAAGMAESQNANGEGIRLATASSLRRSWKPHAACVG